jgi:hypothetical protein
MGASTYVEEVSKDLKVEVAKMHRASPVHTQGKYSVRRKGTWAAASSLGWRRLRGGGFLSHSGFLHQ